MPRIGRPASTVLRGVVCALLALFLSACGSDDCDTAAPQMIVVLSAFPAELAAVLEHTTVDETVEVDGRVFRVGTIGGVHVAVGLTRIGLLNAAATTRAVLDRFPVTGVVFSGVAGSSLRIADVAVPDTWELADGTSYPSHRAWLALAARIAASDAVSLDRCTVVPSSGSQESVCLPHQPAIFVGGVGTSSDTFGDTPFLCQPNGGDVFGCDVPIAAAVARLGGRGATMPRGAVDAEQPTAVDNETAAVAREVTGRGIPFIGFRGVSDGAGDPLGLPGFPAQFFAYYRIAAKNAAAAAAAFVERLDQ
jgi:nucleoside phosphorylase